MLSSLKYLVFRDFANDHIPEIIDETYLKHIYQPYLEGRRDLTIVDWGANQGITSYYFSQYAKQVYAVEPSKQHIEVLLEMIKLNQIKNIKVCPYAISNENGKTKFFHNDNPTMFSMEKVVGTDFEEVETVTSAEFIKRENIKHIDILKMDLEGSESMVISSPEFAAICPKIDVIVGEYHSWTQMSQDLFANTLIDLGFDFHWVPGTVASVFTAQHI